jgi:plastocyanin
MVSRMPRLSFLPIVIATAFAFLPAASHGQAAPTLNGTVGPGFTITLQRPDGTGFEHLDAGTYTIVVRDLADIHNFHLFGPGVNETTTVEQMGTVTWTVTFRDGVYMFQCDPHSESMSGRFAVGSATLPRPPAAPAAPAAPTKLTGRIGPGSRIALTNAAGKRVARVKAGRYRITVRDVSRTENFHLSGPGVNRKTGLRFRGTATWTVRLKAGRYNYRSDASKKVRGVLVVTAASSAHAGHGS